MKILGISGSPKKNGNSEQMINRALAMAEKRGFTTDSVFLSEMEVKPCMHAAIAGKARNVLSKTIWK